MFNLNKEINDLLDLKVNDVVWVSAAGLLRELAKENGLTDNDVSLELKKVVNERKIAEEEKKKELEEKEKIQSEEQDHLFSPVIPVGLLKAKEILHSGGKIKTPTTFNEHDSGVKFKGMGTHKSMYSI